jgi:hypothetical protein
VNFASGAQICGVLKTEHFGKEIKNTWKVFKCGAGEGWRSFRPIVCITKCHGAEE